MLIIRLILIVGGIVLLLWHIRRPIAETAFFVSSRHISIRWRRSILWRQYLDVIIDPSAPSETVYGLTACARVTGTIVALYSSPVEPRFTLGDGVIVTLSREQRLYVGRNGHVPRSSNSTSKPTKIWHAQYVGAVAQCIQE